MQLRQRFADRGAVTGIWPPDPEPVEKRHDRRRPPGNLAEHPALLVLDRLRACDAARGEMLHQAQKKRQVAFRDALFVQRENEISGAGVHQEIRVLDALRDAFVGEQFADVIT